MNLPAINFNERKKTAILLSICLLALLAILCAGILVPEKKLATNLENSRINPSRVHILGTDWLGRDLLARIARGLVKSFFIGLVSALIGAGIAVGIGLVSALAGKTADRIVTFAIDMVLALPHIVLLILLAFAMGGGTSGVIIAVALTHWPSLCRIVRAEIIQLRESEFVKVSQKMGRTKKWIAVHHMFPHMASQVAIGVILLFPHAILHAASLAFLGFGLNPSDPSLGVLLREAMMHLSTGCWWIAVFPGLALLILVLIFDTIGKNLKKLLDPSTTQD
jgi:peptide/nickel transport system permease protein